MEEPEKPFACTIPDCRMTFTNEDHLHVHIRKHDMVLQLGSEQKAAFVADQTPTPTRFIRNCEEVGLFQDLQNVNPFDEGFKRAMETKQSILSLESMMGSSEELHTPQMVFPLLETDSALFTSNNQRNITISRSSSDESGAVKEFETTTISKLTNEVTTISRIVEKHDEPKADDCRQKDTVRKDAVYTHTNNVIKILSNVEIRKDNEKPKQTVISYEDTVIKDTNVVAKDGFDPNKLHVADIPPIMSQKSIDYVVDSLTNDICKSKEDSAKSKSNENYEVIIKLPNGKEVRMKSVEEVEKKQNAKEKLKRTLTEKAIQRNAPSVPQIVAGTLIPVTIVSNTGIVPKVPIAPFHVGRPFDKKPAKRKSVTDVNRNLNGDKTGEPSKTAHERTSHDDTPANRKTEKRKPDAAPDEDRRQTMDSKCAASRRYRARLKASWQRQALELRALRRDNERLAALLRAHAAACPDPRLREELLDKLQRYASPP